MSRILPPQILRLNARAQQESAASSRYVCERSVRARGASASRLSVERLSVPSVDLSVSDRSLKGGPHPR